MRPHRRFVSKVAIAALPSVENRPAKFDLTVSVSETEQEFAVSFTYDSAIFEAATITRLGAHFITLLEAIVANPEAPIASLKLLTDAEQHQILVEWNATRTDYHGDRGVHELFELQAQRSPEAVAVRYGTDRLTYRELNIRANRLAHYLKNIGVAPEEPIAVCVDRSLELFSALLGILKAGGAYVPLDSSYPAPRLSLMLEGSGVRTLVTERSLLDKFPEDRYPEDSLRKIVLDGDAEVISREPSENPHSVTAGEHAAYVIYTSGSTGKPKAVIVTHKAITRLITSTNYIELKSTDVVAQSSNASFDAITFEIWGALLNGAQVAILPKEILLSPKVFATEIRSQKINVMFLTTALFNQIARAVPLRVS